MAKPKPILPIIALLITSILWGINAPVIKLGLESIPVSIFISIKFIIISLLLLPFAVKTWKPLKSKELGVLILGSLIWFTANNLALNFGLHDAPSINSGIINLLGPLLLFMLSAEFLKERISLRSFIGVLIAFVGAMVIIGRPWEIASGNQTVLLGNVLLLVSVLCSVIGILIVKPVLKKTSTAQATFIYLFAGVAPIALYSLTQLKSWGIHDITTGGWEALAYSVVALPPANLLFMYGLKYKQAHGVAVYEYLQAVTVIIAAWFILGEHPSPTFVVGATLVFLGVYLAEFSKSTKSRLTNFKQRV
jgi:drug/metabolite transporter (DMT)-like permease